MKKNIILVGKAVLLSELLAEMLSKKIRRNIISRSQKEIIKNFGGLTDGWIYDVTNHLQTNVGLVIIILENTNYIKGAKLHGRLFCDLPNAQKLYLGFDCKSQYKFLRNEDNFIELTKDKHIDTIIQWIKESKL